MTDDFYTGVYNPDVLSCLANLSNDEVFTPPGIANQMLDLLPQELFASPDTKFLDPACKSGVFLREIAKRLLKGLEPLIPDLQQRTDHIFRNQLYAIAITELTSLLSRRGVYCSKYPNSDYSVTRFNDAAGNIRFKRVPHAWKNTKCIYCGASQSQYDRDLSLETHAYEFIHTVAPKELINMKFDVIVGNPPYQLSDGGHGPSAIPIYQKFVQQAKKLMPRYISMITPSRWFTGGRGLENFREEMLHDDRIRVVHDFFNASDIFPGVEVKGGVCYFLWDRDNRGLCEITTHKSNQLTSNSIRPLLEQDMTTLLRNVEQISILRKVRSLNERSFADIVTANDPFGFDVRVEGSYKRIKPVFSKEPFPSAVHFYYNGWKKEGLGYIGRKEIKKNVDLIDKYKIFVPKAWGSGDPTADWLNPFIVSPNSASTETYLTVGPFEDKKTADNTLTYIQTKFFHFMVSMMKITQNAMKNIYYLVPLVDLSKSWTDLELYSKYGFNKEEIDFIESTIRTMELEGVDDVT